MKSIFHVYNDASHGWLKVTTDDLFLIGLKPQDFSDYSYQDGKDLYLEEDCDLPKFVKQWMAYNRKPITLKNHYTNHPSRIRSYPRIARNAWENKIATEKMVHIY